jgi:hypothetical protein
MQALRVIINQVAVIYADDRTQPIVCTIANISGEGAGLTVLNTNAVPEIFELQVEGEPRRRRCKTAWKNPPHHLGVAFIVEGRSAVRNRVTTELQTYSPPNRLVSNGKSGSSRSIC